MLFRSLSWTDTHEAEKQRAFEVLHLGYDESRPPLARVRLRDGNTWADAEEREAGRRARHDRPDAERPAKTDVIQQCVEHERKDESWFRIQLGGTWSEWQSHVPPTPVPANIIPPASPLRSENHCGSRIITGKYMMPPLKPRPMPCRRMRCQTFNKTHQTHRKKPY